MQPLFTTRPRPPARLDAYSYDLAPDGARILVNVLLEEPASPAITLIVNWPGALIRRQ